MTHPFFIAAVLAALLAGCTSAPRAPAPRPSGAIPPAADTSLAAEQRRLAYLFRGTPVSITMQGDSALRAEVPLPYCFDAGRAKIKPPLAAVLDRLAAGPRAGAARWSLMAPPDPGNPGSPLVAERNASLRDYLVARGVPAARLRAVPADSDAGVRIVVTAD